MNRIEAEALAIKRETHKSPGLKHKVWKAIQDTGGNWSVSLVDNIKEVAKQEHDNAVERARKAFYQGDGYALLDAAGDALIAKVKYFLADHDDDTQGG